MSDSLFEFPLDYTYFDGFIKFLIKMIFLFILLIQIEAVFFFFGNILKKIQPKNQLRKSILNIGATWEK